MAGYCRGGRRRCSGVHSQFRRIGAAGRNDRVPQPAPELGAADRLWGWLRAGAGGRARSPGLAEHARRGVRDILISFTGYSSFTAAPFGFQAIRLNLPLMYVFPLAALLTLLVSVRDWRGCLLDRRLHLSAAFVLAGFLGCYPRPDIWHISYTAPLALPSIAYCVTKLTQSPRPAYRYAAAAVLIALCVPSVHEYEWRARQALRTGIVPTPRGDVVLIGPFAADRGIPELLAGIAATPSGDPYFFYPYDEMLIFLTARQHVSKYDLFSPGYMTPAQYQEACRSAVRNASWVVVDENWDYSMWKLGFPGPQMLSRRKSPGSSKRWIAPSNWLSKDGKFELRRRREGASDLICDGIAEK